MLEDDDHRLIGLDANTSECEDSQSMIKSRLNKIRVKSYSSKVNVISKDYRGNNRNRNICSLYFSKKDCYINQNCEHQMYECMNEKVYVVQKYITF